jgi:hypothetical protein
VGSKSSIGSMSSKGWGFRKAGAAIPYLLFFVSYSLFLCVFSTHTYQNVQCVQKVGDFYQIIAELSRILSV